MSGINQGHFIRGPISKRHLLFAVASLVVLGFFALSIDMPTARYFFREPLPGEVGRVLKRIEPFGHAYGVAMILITMVSLDPKGLRRAPRLLVCSLGAGIAADVIKVLVLRVRPYAYLEGRMSGSTFHGSILNFTQDGFFRAFETELHSCPSAHTATAVGLAIVLSHYYPRGAKWFATLAALVALNRVHGTAHYISDVCWGAAVGYVTAFSTFQRNRVARWLASFESKPADGLTTEIKPRLAA